MRLSLRPEIAAIALLAIACAAHNRPDVESEARSPEQIVYAHLSDDVFDAGVLFAPPRDSAKRLLIVWIHGWGVNFYQPSYVAIGRALAQHGYTLIAGNTRMRDLGNIETYHGDTHSRRGLLGVADEEPRDLAARIDLAEQRGFMQVILVGHSAGWSAVRSYEADRQDPVRDFPSTDSRFGRLE